MKLTSIIIMKQAKPSEVTADDLHRPSIFGFWPLIICDMILMIIDDDGFPPNISIMIKYWKILRASWNEHHTKKNGQIIRSNLMLNAD